MPRAHPRPAALAAGLALLGAACSSSATDPSSKPLSASEASALAATLGSPSSLGLAFTGSAVTAGVGTATGSRFAFTANCPLGGTVSGSVDVTDPPNADGTGTVTGTMSYAPRACVVSTGSRTVTVDGDPSVLTTFTLAVTSRTATPAVTSMVKGGVRVDGVACALDYAVAAAQGGRPSVTGTVCGRAVSGTY